MNPPSSPRPTCPVCTTCPRGGDALPHAIGAALANEVLLGDVRAAAYETLRAHPLSRGLDVMVGAAEALRAAPVPKRLPDRTRREPYPHPARTAPLLDTTSDVAVIRQSLREVRLDLQQLRRDVAALRLVGTDGAAPLGASVLTTTPTWSTAQPAVSVIIALFNHGEYVIAALDSVASNQQDLELVVVDDGSTDDSRSVVTKWLSEHPWIPARLVGHTLNRGLPVARNTAVSFSRAPSIFVLDADNEIYPDCIAQLRCALDAIPLRGSPTECSNASTPTARPGSSTSSPGSRGGWCR